MADQAAPSAATVSTPAATTITSLKQRTSDLEKGAAAAVVAAAAAAGRAASARAAAMASITSAGGGRGPTTSPASELTSAIMSALPSSLAAKLMTGPRNTNTKAAATPEPTITISALDTMPPKKEEQAEVEEAKVDAPATHVLASMAVPMVRQAGGSAAMPAGVRVSGPSSPLPAPAAGGGAAAQAAASAAAVATATATATLPSAAAEAYDSKIAAVKAAAAEVILKDTLPTALGPYAADAVSGSERITDNIDDLAAALATDAPFEYKVAFDRMPPLSWVAPVEGLTLTVAAAGDDASVDDAAAAQLVAARKEKG